jgi:hypothetical protein
MSENMLPLRDVVRALRAELLEASATSKYENLRFEVGPIEVEFTVFAKQEGGPEGKITFSILGLGAELGANAKFGRETTQRVKLTLTPSRTLADGTTGQLEINDHLRQGADIPTNEDPLIREP